MLGSLIDWSAVLWDGEERPRLTRTAIILLAHSSVISFTHTTATEKYKPKF